MELTNFGGLDSLLSDDLNPLFWGSIRKGVPSAWYGHVPFAHWLVGAHQPQTVVELGTHFGVSYFAFCHSMYLNRNLGRCFAVDSWEGDRHAGFYTAETYTDVKIFNATYFASFSTLMRMTFNAAVDQFTNGQIDLLHIDGLHTYEAVKLDFETWLPKLSTRAVVLFHDIGVRENGFGVWQLWEELRDRYPSFSFDHASGLGVLAVGTDQPRPVSDLCGLRDLPAVTRIRDRFCAMGELVRLQSAA